MSYLHDLESTHLHDLEMLLYAYNESSSESYRKTLYDDSNNNNNTMIVTVMAGTKPNHQGMISRISRGQVSKPTGTESVLIIYSSHIFKLCSPK